jgi:hypothetical protein
MPIMSLIQEELRLFGTEDQRRVLSRAFFKLMEHWGLANEETARLLGWTYKTNRTRIDNMRKGLTGLPQDQDKFERVRDLINIHKSLRILFPNQRNLVYEWVKVPRERFGGYAALDVMLEDGKTGISAIRRYLDYERAH